MPYVHITVRDALIEVTDDELREELRARTRRKASCSGDEPEPWTPGGLADDLRAAFYRRDASLFEALLTVLQPHDQAGGLAA